MNYYRVEKVSLYIDFSSIESLTDNSFVKFHKILRFSRDAYYSSAGNRSAKAEEFFRRLIKLTFILSEKYSSLSFKSEQALNAKGETDTLTKEEYAKLYLSPSTYEAHFSKIAGKYIIALRREKIQIFRKLLKTIGFITKFDDSGIDIIGWKLPNALSDSESFIELFDGLSMVSVIHYCNFKESSIIIKKQVSSQIKAYEHVEHILTKHCNAEEGRYNDFIYTTKRDRIETNKKENYFDSGAAISDNVSDHTLYGMYRAALIKKRWAVHPPVDKLT